MILQPKFAFMSGFRLFAKKILPCVLLPFVGVLPQPALASLLFCNQTTQAIETSVGYRQSGAWHADGWWQIQPGQCARVINGPLEQRHYFYYARALSLPGKDGAAPMTWGGKYAFCIDKKAFRIDGMEKCESRGYQPVGFQDVDVGPKQTNYTLTFQDMSGY